MKEIKEKCVVSKSLIPLDIKLNFGKLLNEKIYFCEEGKHWCKYRSKTLCYKHRISLMEL